MSFKIYIKELFRPFYFNGNHYLKFETGSPYYVSGTKSRIGTNRLEKVLFRFFNHYLVIRSDEVTGFALKLENILKSQFDKVQGLICYLKVIDDNNQTQYHSIYLEDNRWVLGQFYKGNMKTIKNEPAVFYSPKNNKFYTFTHRGKIGVGIGDMLFDPQNEVSDEYYWNDILIVQKFIDAINWQYNNNLLFKDANFEDLQNILKAGIKTVVPLNKRGRKIIETKEEAIEAARNLYKYLN